MPTSFFSQSTAYPLSYLSCSTVQEEEGNRSPLRGLSHGAPFRPPSTHPPIRPNHPLQPPSPKPKTRHSPGNPIAVNGLNPPGPLLAAALEFSPAAPGTPNIWLEFSCVSGSAGFCPALMFVGTPEEAEDEVEGFAAPFTIWTVCLRGC